MKTKSYAMRKSLLILTPVFCILMICACSKSNKSNTSQGLVGTWNFLGVSAQSKMVVSEGSGVTMVAYPAFVTTNNLGSITFSKDSMSASGIGYKVDTAFWAYFYYGSSVYYDSTRQTLSYTVPPTSTSSKYSLIGTDSIYFPKGGLLTTFDSASTGQGCTYVLRGDSLLLSTGGVDTTGGETSYVSVITMKRAK